MPNNYQDCPEFMAWLEAKETEWGYSYDGYHEVLYAAYCAGKESK